MSQNHEPDNAMTLIDGYLAALTINDDNSRQLVVCNAFGNELLNVALWDQASLVKTWNKTFRSGISAQLKALWLSV